MNKILSISISRTMAALLTVAFVFGPIAPVTVYADLITDARLCERNGGVWNGTSCNMPVPPPDVCPNVPGDQPSGPCADTECTTNGGTWNGTSCDPAPGEPPPPPPPPADACPNVPGAQSSGPCADTECASNSGIWTGDTCVFPVVDLTASSTSSTDSAEVPVEQSDTDNSDFQDIGNAPAPNANDTRPTVDVSATTTEMAAIEPVLTVASSTDGTGAKIGGTIFTGNATASTTVKNVLNITRANVDGPGVTNSSKITASTDNEGTLTTAADTRAFTGENKALGGEGTATIATGKAVATAEVLNVVNTTLFNSNGMVLFLNPLNGDGFDLRRFDLSYFLNGGPGSSPTQYGCTILTCLNSSDLSILNKNTAEVTNDVEVRAETGRNTATSTRTGDAFIETGDAYAAANVLNMVNTNFVNSSYLILSMNNFGDLNDDIVLPEASFFEQLLASGNSLPDMNSSSYVVNNDNDENFFGTTTATAITGENIATTTGTAFGSGEIHTGNAYTSTNSYTAANQTKVGGSSVLLSFRVWGEWSGRIQGLPAGMSWRATHAGDGRSWLIEIISSGGSSGAGGAGTYNSSDFMASSTNVANVRTDVNAWAVTGQNVTETEDGLGHISTGDAYAAANVVNMVNTNIVGRNMVFATFNIFGDWSGDITFGGHSPNLKVTAVVDTPNPTIPGSDVAYRFTVANNGDVDANNVMLDTTYSKNLLFFSRSNVRGTDTTTGTRYSLGTIAAGSSQEITVTARVLAPGLTSGFMAIPLSATVSARERDQNDADNSASVTLVVSTSGSAGGNTSTSTATSTIQGGGTGGGGSGSTGSGSSGGTTTPPPTSGGGGGGGGSTPTTTTGGGGGGGGGSTTATSGGGSAGPTTGSAAPLGPTTSATASSGATSGGNSVPVVFVSASSTPGISNADARNDPKITIIKTAAYSTASSTPLSIVIDYTVVVTNMKGARPGYRTVLTDTLYDPWNKSMYTRSWPLDTMEPGDQVTLTYSVAFDTYKTRPGTYKNVAKLTGQRNDTTYAPMVSKMPTTEGFGTVTFAAGAVLGASAAAPVAAAACVPLLTSTLRRGSSNTDEVKTLQQFLNAEMGSNLPVSGVYGPMTEVVVRAFQEKYADEILTPNGLRRGTGSVGPSTLKKINELACAASGGVPATSSVQSTGTSTTTEATAAPAPAPAPAPLVSEQTAAVPPPTKKKANPLPPLPTKKTTSSSGEGGLLNGLGGMFSTLRW